MAMIERFGTCDNGPCPTIWRNTVTGGVRIRGKLDIPPNLSQDIDPLPDDEGDIYIPPQAWAKLLAQVIQHP